MKQAIPVTMIIAGSTLISIPYAGYLIFLSVIATAPDLEIEKVGYAMSEIPFMNWPIYTPLFLVGFTLIFIGIRQSTKLIQS